MEEARQQREQLTVNARIARQEALVQQADAQLDVAIVHHATLRRRVDRVAQTEALVPQPAKKRRQSVAARRPPGFLLHQQEQVHIGLREQFAPAESAHGQQGHPPWEGRGQQFLKRTDHLAVDERGPPVENLGRVPGLEKHLRDQVLRGAISHQRAGSPRSSLRILTASATS